MLPNKLGSIPLGGSLVTATPALPPKSIVRLSSYAILSIVAALTTLGLKYTAYLLTGSIGLLSDALESCINLIAALTAFVTLIYAARPVDATHTYGHEKIEFFASGLEGLLILLAGIGIIAVSISRIVDHPPLERLGLGTLIAGIASLVNWVVARILLSAGHRHRSIVLEADGKHLLTDVWTSLAVLLGLVFVTITHVEIIDPIIAIAVGLNINYVGFQLIRRSFNGLMDHALPTLEVERIRETIRKSLPEGASFHAMRSRQAGARRFVDFHLLVPGNRSVQEAHDQAETIERALHTEYTHLEVTIHIEPIEAPASWEDNALAGIEPEAISQVP